LNGCADTTVASTPDTELQNI